MNIFITGGTNGLGEYLVKKFAANPNNKIIATGTNARKIKKLSSDKKLANVIFIGCDFKHLSELKKIIKSVDKIFEGNLDLFINNAAIAYHGRTSEIIANQLEEVISVNTFAPIFLTSRLINLMDRGSRIINISSYLGSKGKPLTATYTASKHALNGFSKVTRMELAERGIGVVQIEPGPLKTSFNNRTSNREMRAYLKKNKVYRIPVEVIADYIDLVVNTDRNVCPELIRIMPTEMSS